VTPVIIAIKPATMAEGEESVSGRNGVCVTSVMQSIPEAAVWTELQAYTQLSQFVAIQP
jgi:hypothetical protein